MGHTCNFCGRQRHSLSALDACKCSINGAPMLPETEEKPKEYLSSKIFEMNQKINKLEEKLGTSNLKSKVKQEIERIDFILDVHSRRIELVEKAVEPPAVKSVIYAHKIDGLEERISQLEQTKFKAFHDIYEQGRFDALMDKELSKPTAKAEPCQACADMIFPPKVCPDSVKSEQVDQIKSILEHSQVSYGDHMRFIPPENYDNIVDAIKHMTTRDKDEVGIPRELAQKWLNCSWSYEQGTTLSALTDAIRKALAEQGRNG